jgi:hypothetical protein
MNLTNLIYLAIGFILGCLVCIIAKLVMMHKAEKRFIEVLKDIDKRKCTKDPNTCKLPFCDWPKCMNDENDTKENM